MPTKSANIAISVFSKINKKPKVFFKKLISFWYCELIYSQVIPAYYEKEEVWLVQEVMKYADGSPRIAKQIFNIIRCLENKYPWDNYDYGDDTYVSSAIKLHSKYKTQIEAYLQMKLEKKRFVIGDYDTIAKDLFLELVYRGFFPIQFCGFKPKVLYIEANIQGSILALPNPTGSDMEAKRLFKEFEIKGYTLLKRM